MSDFNQAKRDTKEIYITLNVTPEQLKILAEILHMKGLGFPAEQGIAVGTLLELVQTKSPEG